MGAPQSYSKMVVTAIAALGDRSGSSLTAIKTAISAAYPTLAPGAVARSTLAAVKKMVASGELTKVKSSYKLSAKAKTAAKKPAKKKTAAKKKTTAKKKPAAKKTTKKKTAAKKT